MEIKIKEVGIAKKGDRIEEVVIGLAPAFKKYQHKTITDVPHDMVLMELIAGIEEEGLIARVVRVNRTSDVCF
ncbi:glycerol dehydratase reactivase beta/small subunit family protein, partial [Cetobacterium sp.]